MHTPGPWKTGPINYADVYGANGEVVALLPKGFSETIDNALLISTAPDLLETLKTLDSRGGLGLDVHEWIRKVIAKAEGRDA